MSNEDKTLSQLVWDICGHEKIVNFLKSAVLNKHLSHAYIFVGPDGLGKLTVAKKLAASLLCVSNDHQPCGDCPNCRQLDHGVHPDFFYVERMTDEKSGKLKREIVIDQIRDLKQRLSQASFLGGYKTAIIDGAGDMNLNAANSLLKLLEEPSPKTVMILVVNDLNDLPATIASRCQVLHFLPVVKKTLADYLIDKGAAKDRAEYLSRLAVGRPGLALDWLSNKTEAGTIQNQLDVLDKVLSQKINERLKGLEQVIDLTADESSNVLKTHNLLDAWQLSLRDFLLLKNNCHQLAVNIGETKAALAMKTDWPRLMQIYYALENCRELINSGVSTKNALENLVINI